MNNYNDDVIDYESDFKKYFKKKIKSIRDGTGLFNHQSSNNHFKWILKPEKVEFDSICRSSTVSGLVDPCSTEVGVIYGHLDQ